LCFIDGLYGVEQFKTVAMVMGLSAAAVQAGSIAAVTLDAGFNGVALAYIGGAATILAASAWGFVRQVGMPMRPALTARHLLHLRRSWTFFLQNVVTAIQQRADVVVVNGVIGAHGAGLYGASMTLVQKIDLVHDGLSTAMFPRLAQLHGQDAGHARDLVRSTVRMALVASLPLAVGLCVISADVVRLVFGARFDEAGSVLAVMALGIPVRFLYGILFNVHTAMGRQRMVLIASGSAAALTTALMAAGAWLWVAPGAAAAGVAGLGALCVVLCAAYMARHGALASARDLVWLGLSNAAMAGVLLTLHDSNLAVRIAAPAAAYAVIVLACGLVPLAPVRAFLWRSKPLAR